LEASALGSLIAACPAWKRREKRGICRDLQTAMIVLQHRHLVISDIHSSAAAQHWTKRAAWNGGHPGLGFM